MFARWHFREWSSWGGTRYYVEIMLKSPNDQAKNITDVATQHILIEQAYV